MWYSEIPNLAKMSLQFFRTLGGDHWQKPHSLKLRIFCQLLYTGVKISKFIMAPCKNMFLQQDRRSLGSNSDGTIKSKWCFAHLKYAPLFSTVYTSSHSLPFFACGMIKLGRKKYFFSILTNTYQCSFVPSTINKYLCELGICCIVPFK